MSAYINHNTAIAYARHIVARDWNKVEAMDTLGATFEEKVIAWMLAIRHDNEVMITEQFLEYSKLYVENIAGNDVSRHEMSLLNALGRAGMLVWSDGKE